MKDIKFVESSFRNGVSILLQLTETLLPLLTVKMHFSSALLSTLLMLAPATLAEAHKGQNKASKSYADTYLAIRAAVKAFSFAVNARPVPSFDDTFTPNAVMNLSIAGSQQTGAANISTYLSGLLTQFKTQPQIWHPKD